MTKIYCEELRNSEYHSRLIFGYIYVCDISPSLFLHCNKILIE